MRRILLLSYVLTFAAVSSAQITPPSAAEVQAYCIRETFGLAGRLEADSKVNGVTRDEQVRMVKEQLGRSHMNLDVFIALIDAVYASKPDAGPEIRAVFGECVRANSGHLLPEG